MTKRWKTTVVVLVSILMLFGGGVLAKNPHTETKFKIKVAEWDEYRLELFVAGHSGYRCDIIIYNAGDKLNPIGEVYCPDKRWSTTIENPEPVPCHVYAEQLESDTCDYQFDYQDVQYAPDDCGP